MSSLPSFRRSAGASFKLEPVKHLHEKPCDIGFAWTTWT
jgi:hypothetical protein